MAKVLCPFHSDNTPSMEVYPDGYGFCFVCRTRAPLEEVERLSGSVVSIEPRSIAKEDLEASLKYIRGLPKVSLRGLEFHADGNSYYVTKEGWPYYNRRMFDVEGSKGKYKCPSGHPKPLLRAHEALGGETSPILIVEGEINALSIASIGVPATVVCPGGSGDFFSRAGLANIPYYLNFSRQVLICDEDAAGAMAAIELSSKLKQQSKDVQILLMRRDANEVLCVDGKEALRKEICEKAGLGTSMPVWL